MKKISFFDIETDGFDATKVHCIGIYDNSLGRSMLFSGSQIKEGVQYLQDSDIICGHNIIGFDYPILKRLYGLDHGRLMDTLVISRLVAPNVYDRDFLDAPKDMPKSVYGSQGLKAWGYRLGLHKQEIETDWDTYGEEMGEYCLRDVDITYRLYEEMCKYSPSPRSLMLEHQFAKIMQEQTEYGFAFNVKKAESLISKLLKKRVEIEDKLQELFPPVEEETKSALGWSVEVDGHVIEATTKGELKLRLKDQGFKQILVNQAKRTGNKVNVIPFNPSSRVQIEQRFREKYKWEPKILTPNGRAKIDEGVLKELPFEEAPVLNEYLMVQKRLSQIAEGNEAWIKLEKEGRIHGKVNSNGAVTGRCTHSGPNISQVPANGSAYGEDCRELFEATKGYSLVGCDASGLELRCLAHYLYRFDGGDYARAVVTGDIHSVNQKAANLSTRDEAKKFIYAYLYGAGDELIGKIVGGGAREGKKIKSRFLKQTPALSRLKKTIDIILSGKKGLNGLDGRKLHIRSKHSALNALLQSAGAVIMKKATINLKQLLLTNNIKAYNVAHIHDEIQIETEPENAEAVGKLAVLAIQQVTKDFKLKCPLDGEYKIGTNWKETH